MAVDILPVMNTETKFSWQFLTFFVSLTVELRTKDNTVRHRYGDRRGTVIEDVHGA